MPRGTIIIFGMSYPFEKRVRRNRHPALYFDLNCDYSNLFFLEYGRLN